jgi:hypothetical protein
MLKMASTQLHRSIMAPRIDSTKSMAVLGTQVLRQLSLNNKAVAHNVNRTEAALE